MEEIEVTVDRELGSAITALLQFANGAFPHTRDAVRRATVFAKNTWKEAASQAFQHPTGTYVRAIEEGVTYPFQDDPLRGVVVNRDPKARAIEHGYGPFDIKQGLLKSSKAKVSKDGYPYIRVPLRHGLPRERTTEAGKGEERAILASVMPSGVAKQAQALVRQQTAGIGPKRLPDMKWFFQTKLAPRQLGLAPYTWKGGKFAGLVKTRSPGHTQYMTFRTVSAARVSKSGKRKGSSASSWIHPGGKAFQLCEKAKMEAEPGVRALIRAGFEKDLEMLRRQIAGGA